MSTDRNDLSRLKFELEREQFEFEKSERLRWWSKPFNIAVAGGMLTLIGITFTEAQNSRRAYEIEQMRAESARILEVLKAGNKDQAAENLQFLFDLGLVSNIEIAASLNAFLEDREVSEGPLLATSTSAPGAPWCTIAASTAFVKSGVEYAVS